MISYHVRRILDILPTYTPDSYVLMGSELEIIKNHLKCIIEIEASTKTATAQTLSLLRNTCKIIADDMEETLAMIQEINKISNVDEIENNGDPNV